ncbi:MAG: nuclear transport factor 2 family protein [Verrucomicrobiota bacterium]|nr:nuclear transport factor 2 family protein [Verrucomicrobiota bacterium]
MRPRALVQARVEAFNRADVDALTAFYSETAVNHQVAEALVEGREAICAMFRAGFAATEMVCLVENIFEDGEWAILEGRDPKGHRGRMGRAPAEFAEMYWEGEMYLHRSRFQQLPWSAGKRYL